MGNQLLLLATISIAAVGACQSWGPLDEAAETGSIAGWVRSISGDGVPTAELRVKRVGQPGFTTLVKTDRGGRYRIEGLRPGRYVVERTTGSASRVVDSDLVLSVIRWDQTLASPGVPPEVVVSDQDSIAVTAGAVTRWDLQDPERSILKGRMIGTSGQIVRIPIALMDAAWKDREEPLPGEWIYPMVALPDQAGAFQFLDLASGEYDLLAGDMETRHQTRPAQVLEVTLQVQSGRIRGTVVDSLGQPVAGAALYPRPTHRDETLIERAARKSRRFGFERHSSISGAFEIDVSPGRYVVEAWHSCNGRGSLPEIALGDGDLIEGLRIELR